MSRGLGYLQRLILENIEESKLSQTSYRGAVEDYVRKDHVLPGSYGANDWHFVIDPDEVFAGGSRSKLPSDVFDLRKLLKFMARKYDKTSHHNFVTVKFQASFSRAVKTLIERGYLSRYHLYGHFDGTIPQTRFVGLIRQGHGD